MASGLVRKLETWWPLQQEQGAAVQTGLQVKEEEVPPNPTPPTQPPASAFHWLNLLEARCHRCFHTQPARVGTLSCVQGAEQTRCWPATVRHHYLHLHIQRDRHRKAGATWPHITQRVSSEVGSAPRPPGSGNPSLTCSALAPSQSLWSRASRFPSFRPFPLFISAWHRHVPAHTQGLLGSDR